MIMGNMVGGTAPIKTLMIEDESGASFIGVVTENKVVFDATPEDVRAGKIFANDDGIQEGQNTSMSNEVV